MFSAIKVDQHLLKLSMKDGSPSWPQPELTYSAVPITFAFMSVSISLLGTPKR
jgi:hypothetical protein